MKEKRCVFCTFAKYFAKTYNKNTLTCVISRSCWHISVYNTAFVFYNSIHYARGTQPFLLMHEFYASARGPDVRCSRVRISGLGSARCRKICSLKRHVPFVALYIIHKVKAVTVLVRARVHPISKKTLSVPFLDQTLTTSAGHQRGDRDIYYCRARARSSIIFAGGIDQHFHNFQQRTLTRPRKHLLTE